MDLLMVASCYKYIKMLQQTNTRKRERERILEISKFQSEVRYVKLSKRGFLHFSRFSSVWTKCWHKKQTNFFKSCHSSLNLKVMMVFRNTQKVPKIWATFARKFVAKTIQNRPIWSHWFVASCVMKRKPSSTFLVRIIIIKNC